MTFAELKIGSRFLFAVDFEVPSLRLGVCTKIDPRHFRVRRDDTTGVVGYLDQDVWLLADPFPAFTEDDYATVVDDDGQRIAYLRGPRPAVSCTPVNPREHDPRD
jgi:hypothetical protein